MSAPSPKKNYKVAVLIYGGANILDFTGPMQVMSHITHNRNTDDPDPDHVFEVKTIAQESLIHTASSLHIEPDILISDALDSITEYDILIVPGASLSTIQGLIKEPNNAEINLIHRYTTSGSTHSRILFSVCTGALLLAAAGILSGLAVTTHHLALDALRELCSLHSQTKAPTRIVHRQFVHDEGFKGTKVQIISSGGISAGIDAAIYIVCKLLSAEAASLVSETMEYGWMEPLDENWPKKFNCFLD
ncbi:ThiJ/PfpI family protein [Penicillium verhagenii]|uniref:ThiJ/PfpI family protein n=1 Tax=Penicillium verhagenii TaxID=1562060 RepID=UPI0025456CB6|nr:ThiJ/PfpI family protein [Penicillium verhagenii]KAJ5935821.1 ThiJ/PfpI family protein [Penicillium verhagenii]